MPHIKNALIRYRIIDKCLRNKYKKFPSKKDLREACEVSLYGESDGTHICDSTIEKDMFNMKIEHDAPIRYDKMEKGYYYENPDFTINEIPLSANDLEAISFAAKTLSQFRDVEMFKQFGSAIDKIVDSVNVSKDTDAHQYIQFESIPNANGSEFLTSLLGAIKHRLWITFDYASFVTGELKSRRVVPLLLKQYRNRWYLISFDESRKDYITYALDRIEDLVISDEIANQPIDFNADNYFEHAIGITSGNTTPQTIILKVNNIAAKYLDSLPIHKSQKIIEMTDDYFLFRLHVNVSEELIREIMSYGGEIMVIEPQSLIDEINKRAKRILGQ